MKTACVTSPQFPVTGSAADNTNKSTGICNLVLNRKLFLKKHEYNLFFYSNIYKAAMVGGGFGLLGQYS